MLEIIICFLSYIMGGFVQTAAGFGMALVAIPPILLVMEPLRIVPVSVGLSTLQTSVSVARLYHDAEWKVVLPLFFGAMLGVVPGTYMIDILPLALFKRCVGLLILIFTFMLWKGWSCPLKSRVLQVIVGAMSGFLGGSVSISGPPIALFLTAGGLSKRNFRASTLCYFFLLDLVTLAVFMVRGRLDFGHCRLFIILAPAILIGVYLGNRFAERISEVTFRKCVLVLITISGFSLLF